MDTYECKRLRGGTILFKRLARLVERLSVRFELLHALFPTPAVDLLCPPVLLRPYTLASS